MCRAPLTIFTPPAKEHHHCRLHSLERVYLHNRVSAACLVYHQHRHLILTTRDSIISCQKYAVGSNGTIFMDYTEGGRPAVFMPDMLLNSSGVCGFSGPNQYVEPPSAAQAKSGALATVVRGVLLGAAMAVAGVLVW